MSKKSIIHKSSKSSGNGKGPSINGPQDTIDKVEALLSADSEDTKSQLLREMLEGILKLHEQSVDVLDINGQLMDE